MSKIEFSKVGSSVRHGAYYEVLVDDVVRGWTEKEADGWTAWIYRAQSKVTGRSVKMTSGEREKGNPVDAYDMEQTDREMLATLTSEKPVTTVTMQVEVQVCGDKGIRVITDGSRMGTYRSWSKVGEELADEFRHRASQGTRQQVTIMAFVTSQGTAMPETALCDEHEHDPQHATAACDAALGSGDWDGGPRQDCSGNPETRCIACGALGDQA